MKRLVLLFATLTTAALTLACSSDSAPDTATVSPTVTQPVPAASATASATAVPATAAPATTAPNSEPPTQPPAAATQPPAPQPTTPPAPSGPVTIAVSARNLAFDRTSISVLRNATVTVNFTNNDALVAHDFGVSIPFVPHTATCNGPCQVSITFNSGPPGAYTFQCTIHPEMLGTFTVN